MGHIVLTASRRVALACFLAVGVIPLLGADGFGDRTTGGAGGASVTVSTAIDLQTYAASTPPCIITISGTIVTTGNLVVNSNKTIRGADTSSMLIGNLYIGNSAQNIIVQNLSISNPYAVGDGDGVTIINSAKNILVDHCSFTDCVDGSLDITDQADSVTVSWCRFRYVNQTTHRYVCLIGSSDAKLGDLGFLHVTIHHCWFDQNCDERMPSVRFGRVHVYNNYYASETASYGVRTRLYAECLVENNSFEQYQNPWELLRKTGAPDGKLLALNNNVTCMDTSGGNTWVAGWYTTATETSVLIPGTDSVFSPPYSYTLDSTADVRTKVISFAGNRGGVVAVPDDPERISGYELIQNYPNPCNPETKIGFRTPRQNLVILKVFDILGRAVATLVNGEVETGHHEVTFDGSGLASGVYFYCLQVRSLDPAEGGTGSFVDTKKLLLVR
ncbi:T9SS C-terminal target domain-containing protein [bacterium]|nr:MAG: T9SS C-terminal target domain-containing protein [bacterium]